ncbi:MAG TPA: M23 family metallopeptidase [Clostridiaceae bacterium]|nr:M23 family metallopeptidase [Clostridiaceae bacterium]HJJ19385.1 M23 family metallopeptidase [Clostridiaceae bacterium]
MADGTVIKATYSSSYGNMVMIDHRKWHSNFICTWL